MRNRDEEREDRKKRKRERKERKPPPTHTHPYSHHHTLTPTPTPTPKHKILCWTRLSRSGTNKKKTSLNTSPLCRRVFVPDRNTLWRDSAGGWKKEREVLLLS